MERVTSYVEARHFHIGDLYALGVKVRIEVAADRKPFFRRGVGDQRDCDVEADERHGAPVLGDEAEHAMLDLVPLTGSWRIVTYRYVQPRLVRPTLQLHVVRPENWTGA